MKFESIPKKVLVLWELLAVVGFLLLLKLALFILNPHTIVWYVVLWLLGALFVLTAFLYLPLLYVSEQYCVDKREIVFQQGVIFNKVHYMQCNKISFVSVYRNPLTWLLHISTLVVTCPGSRICILFINSDRASEIARQLSHLDG